MKNLVSALSLGAVLVIAPFAANADVAKTTLAKPAGAASIKVGTGNDFSTLETSAAPVTVPTNLPSTYTFATPNFVVNGVKEAKNYAKDEVEDLRQELVSKGVLGEVDITSQVYTAAAAMMAQYIKAADTWPTTPTTAVATEAVYTVPAQM